jgi:hypothetical protein
MEPLLVYYNGNSDAISESKAGHVEEWHNIIIIYESDLKELCGEVGWRKLHIRLMGRCLGIELIEHYDRYQRELQ